MGYSRPNDAITAHCRATVKYSTPISGKIQDINFIPEGDIYRLIIRSKLPSSVRFETWVFDEVLPSIRKHGAYLSDTKIEEILTSPDTIISLATQLKEERLSKIKLQEVIQEQEPLVDFAHQVSDTTDLIDMNQMAKLLKRESYKIGRNRLFQFLRSEKVLMSNNLPYQRFIEQGYFKTKEVMKQEKVYIATYVTGKGQLYVNNLVREKYVA